MARTLELPKVIDMSGAGFDLVLKTARRDIKKNGDPMRCRDCGNLIHKGERYYNYEWRGDYCHFTRPVCLECAITSVAKDRDAYAVGL